MEMTIQSYLLLALAYRISAASIQDYIDEFGKTTTVTFNYGDVRPLSCDTADPDTNRHYTWFTEGGITFEDMDHIQLTKISDDYNDVTIKIEEQSDIAGLIVYCMEGQRIINMIQLLYKGHELWFDDYDHMMEAPCPLAEGYLTALSCKGATWQETGRCTWSRLNTQTWRYEEVLDDAEPVLVLGRDVPAEPGEYKCNCLIAGRKTLLHKFNVENAGRPENSYFCKHIPESSLTRSLTTASGSTLTSGFLETTVGESPSSSQSTTSSTASVAATTTPEINARTIPLCRNPEPTDDGKSTTTTAKETTKPASTLPGQIRPSPKVKVVQPAPGDDSHDDPNVALHSQKPSPETSEVTPKDLTSILVGVIVILAVVAFASICVVVTVLIRRSRRRRRDVIRQPESLEMIYVNSGNQENSNRLLNEKAQLGMQVTSHNEHNYV